jgi:hypothetical protein
MFLSKHLDSPYDNLAPIILFGMFNRHNFGDLLFAQIVSALLQNKSLWCAGLLQHDLRAYGGHPVHAVNGPGGTF